jgi:hypothetical protein
MDSELFRLQGSSAVQEALAGFSRPGRSAFIERYGFGKFSNFLVRNYRSGDLCNSEALVCSAFRYQLPEEAAGEISSHLAENGRRVLAARNRQ